MKRLGANQPLRLWRVNTGKAVGWSHIKGVLDLIKKGQVSAGIAMLKRLPLTTYGTPGQADLQGVADGGRFIGIEVKKPGETLKDDQLAWGEMISRRGGVYIMVTSADDAVKQLTVHGVLK